MGQDVRHDVTQKGQGTRRGSRVVMRGGGVLDAGWVLEVIDDSIFPGPFEERHGVAPGSPTRSSTSGRWLFDWFAGLRPRGLRTGILTNSWPGAREAERHHGFEEVAGVLQADVVAARTAGWHGVLQVETERSIAEIETVIRRQAAG